MRLKCGDQVQAFDGSGRLYQRRIIDTGGGEVKLEIKAVADYRPKKQLEITLVQALPKGKKLDYIIEKCTELGITTIIPTQTARSVVRLNQERINSRRRWQRIAQEAAQQCQRTSLPQIKRVTPWSEVLAILKEFDLRLLFCLSQKCKRLKQLLPAHNKSRKIVFLIGPEGDFTPQEVDQAEDKGCLPVSLGETILKSDTAAVSALAMINYELRQ